MNIESLFDEGEWVNAKTIPPGSSPPRETTDVNLEHRARAFGGSLSCKGLNNRINMVDWGELRERVQDLIRSQLIDGWHLFDSAGDHWTLDSDELAMATFCALYTRHHTSIFLPERHNMVDCK